MMLRWVAIIAVAAACSTSAPAPAAKSDAKHEDRHDPPTAPAKLRLEVETGGATTIWADAELAKVAKIPGAASDGEARDTWSVRELVHALVGPTARVTTVIGPDGPMTITTADWDDPAKTPILHTTRRGTLKFRWADAKGAWGETAVRDVSRIVVEK